MSRYLTQEHLEQLEELLKYKEQLKSSGLSRCGRVSSKVETEIIQLREEIANLSYYLKQ